MVDTERSDRNGAKVEVSSSEPKNLKPLPEIKRVLKPASSSLSNRKSESGEDQLSGKLKAMSLNAPGKFENSANGADTEEFGYGIEGYLRLCRRNAEYHQFIKKSKYVRKVDIKGDLESFMSDDYSGMQADDIDPAELEKPLPRIKGLEVELLPHQCVGVNFMSARENPNNKVSGGLLADDMGLGKTIQSIALILNRPPEPEAESRTTLIVMPLAVLDQWRDEILRVAPRLNPVKYQGPSRRVIVPTLRESDIVLTTYDVITRDGMDGPLQQIRWYRIIADEAHAFRNRSTALASLMCNLKSNGRRWALTGTPIHNQIYDICTLFEFIKAPLPPNYGNSKKVIQEQAKITKYVGGLLKSIMLRRSQKVLDGRLPDLERTTQSVELNERERKLYDVAVTMMQMRVFGLAGLMRMRQGCNGILMEEQIPKVLRDWEDADDKAGQSELEAEVEAEPEEEVKRDDAKIKKSLETNADDDDDDALSSMLKQLSIKKDQTKDDNNFMFADNSKVQAVRKILVEERTRKTVLFSSFVTMLEALRPMLDHEGITYRLYTGRLQADERKRILDQFRNPRLGVTVLLCSLQTAAVGLNLTSASRVIFADPWWNPQIVDQAVKRVHRLGQKTAVKSIELYAVNAMEQRMIELQKRKRRMASRLLDKHEKLSAVETRYLLYGKEEDKEGALSDKSNEKPEPKSRRSDRRRNPVGFGEDATHRKPVKAKASDTTPKSPNPPPPENGSTRSGAELSTVMAKDLPKIKKHIKFTD